MNYPAASRRGIKELKESLAASCGVFDPKGEIKMSNKSIQRTAKNAAADFWRWASLH
jgi:hypothetical protein